MCSQPIVQDAQPERATRRISRRLAGAATLAPLAVSSPWSLSPWALSPWSGPRRSAPSNVAAWVFRGADLGGGGDGDRLEVLGAHDGAEAAAAGVPAVVRDCRVPDAALAGRA